MGTKPDDFEGIAKEMSGPVREDVKLQKNGGSVVGILDPDALRDVGIDPTDYRPSEDSISVPRYWMDGKDLLVFDLSAASVEVDDE